MSFEIPPNLQPFTLQLLDEDDETFQDFTFYVSESHARKLEGEDDEDEEEDGDEYYDEDHDDGEEEESEEEESEEEEGTNDEDDEEDSNQENSSNEDSGDEDNSNEEEHHNDNCVSSDQESPQFVRFVSIPGVYIPKPKPKPKSKPKRKAPMTTLSLFGKMAHFYGERQIPKDMIVKRKPPNAFLLFRRDHYGDLRAQYPDRPNTDISKMIAERWQNLPPLEKRSYQERSITLGEKHAKLYAHWMLGRIHRRKKIEMTRKIKKRVPPGVIIKSEIIEIKSEYWETSPQEEEEEDSYDSDSSEDDEEDTSE